ncbi:MAG UNVERIFIED_CONTAM: hypothetical protein LVT10_15000 [Anaerolineae bacterium]
MITVDTAVAHLAGALDKECWVLVPSLPDWRWGAENAQTPGILRSEFSVKLRANNGGTCLPV